MVLNHTNILMTLFFGCTCRLPSSRELHPALLAVHKAIAQDLLQGGDLWQQVVRGSTPESLEELKAYAKEVVEVRAGRVTIHQ